MGATMGPIDGLKKFMDVSRTKLRDNNDFSKLDPMEWIRVGKKLTWGLLMTIWSRALDEAEQEHVRLLANNVTAWIESVTRREVVFCLAGMGIGTVIGYNVAVRYRLRLRKIEKMKAILCHHYTGIEGVSMIDDAEAPTIRPNSNELLIEVKASSLNVVDTKISHGYSRAYRKLLNSGHAKELPVILGRDCAGIVVEMGQFVERFDVGDEVFLAVPSWAPGTMAQYIVVDETQVAKRPQRISFEASACLPYSGCLAWDAMVNQSIIVDGNAEGKRILVYGCSPVGCILIQLGKLWGAHVTVLCHRDRNLVVQSLGADRIIGMDKPSIEINLHVSVKYHAIFYTVEGLINKEILKRYLISNGSFVSTVPEPIASDSFGFILGSIFSAYVRVTVLLQYMFGGNSRKWVDGSKIISSNLEMLRQLVEADQLQSVLGGAFRPDQFEQALNHVNNWDILGGTVIRF